ncbi:MAG: hypothetical protein WC872_01220 [Candidatus Absconditabacterales bacterium]
MEKIKSFLKKYINQKNISYILNNINYIIKIFVQKITDHNIVEKFFGIKIVYDILHSNSFNVIDKKIQNYLKAIFTVIGIISIISGIVGIFSFLVSLSGLGFVFSLGFWIGIRIFIYILIAFAISLLSLYLGIGIVRFKKWILPLAIVGFYSLCVLFVISLLPVGLSSLNAYAKSGSMFFSLILNFVLLMFILKNKEMFNN